MQTGKDGNGTYTYGIEVRTDMGAAPVSAGLSLSGGGDAELRAAGEGQWTLLLKGGEGSLFGQGSVGGMTITTSVTAQGGDALIPATTGLYCSTN